MCFRYYKLFLTLIDFILLKNQVKIFFNVLVILNDGFHDLDNEPVDSFFPKTNRNFVYAKAVKGFQEAERK